MENQEISQISENMPCPFCAESILIEAKKCKHCGEYLSNNTITNKNNKQYDISQIMILTGCCLLIISLYMPWFNIFFYKISPMESLKFIESFGEKDGGVKGVIFCIFMPGIAGIIALTQAFKPTQNSKKVLRVAGIVAIITLFLVILFLVGKLGKQVDVSKLIASGWYVSLIGSILLLRGTYKKYFMNPLDNNKIQVMTIVPKTLSTEELAIKETYEKAQAVQRAEKNAKREEQVKIFIEKVKKHGLKVTSISFLSISLLFGIYYLIVPNPKKEGENAAKAKCICIENEQKNIIANLKVMLSQLDNGSFKRRLEARNKLSEINNFSIDFQKCSISSYNNLRSKFADNYEKLQTFENAYNNYNCGNESELLLNNTIKDIENKISLIKDPEPDIDMLKNDIIGKEIPGWRFEYLSDFKDFKISNTIKTQERIEYTIDMKLKKNGDESDHDCQVIAIYNQNENGWWLSDVKMQLITYNNTFYPDKLTTITPLSNCRWSADNNYNLGWKTYNWEWAPLYKSGPEIGPVSLPNSNVYYVYSLEDKAVNVRFTYRPMYTE